MSYDLGSDKEFAAIELAADAAGGLLMDGWIEYQGEKWHPVVIRDRVSGKRGFEVNFSGKWGKNDEVGRRKLELGEFLLAIAGEVIPRGAGIRCIRLDDSQRNGRHMDHFKMPDRLAAIITRLRA